MERPHPIASPTEPVGHQPTADLLAALAEHQWVTRAMSEDLPGRRVAITTTHPRATETLRVTMSLDDKTRISAVFIGDRQVPFRAAIDYVRSVP